MRIRPARPVNLTHSFTDDGEPATPIGAVTARITGPDGHPLAELPAAIVGSRWAVTTTLPALGVFAVEWITDTGITDTDTAEAIGRPADRVRDRDPRRRSCRRAVCELNVLAQ